MIGLSLLAAALVIVVAAPTTASAGSIRCKGSLALTDEIPGLDEGIEYEFFCNEPFRAFSIVTNKTVDYFETEVFGTTPDGQGTSDSFFCEGKVPGHGFGCPGTGSFNNIISGGFATEEDPCPPRVRSKPREPRLNAWLTVTSQETRTNDTVSPPTSTTVTTQSAPFSLSGPDCPKGEKRK